MQSHFPARDHALNGFDYRAAFSRNIGWITEWEQHQLRKKTVAIAGMGGVGGIHALTLTRLGIGGFHFADPDQFDVVNLNRQAGSFLSTVGLEKTAVMANMAHDINPELRVNVFNEGVTDANLDEFLSGVDLFVDGLDFFVIDIRRKVFKRAAQLGIPAITAAPIGFGSCYLIFMPNGMSFEDYFRLEGLPEQKQLVNFAVGLTPAGFHRSYLVDPSRLDLARRRGPSSAAAVQLCAGIVASEAVKILLGRGKVHAAPFYHQFDAYRGRWKRGRLPYGNAGPLQSLKLRIGYGVFARLSQNARPEESPSAESEIARILDLARWAPSGDNAQPWRFEITGDDKLIVRLHVEGESKNIYEYANGQPTLLSCGFLLETIRIAASRFQRAMEWTYRGCEGLGSDGAEHTIEVSLRGDPSIREHPLCRYIPIRSVDRRAYQRRSLTPQQKAELEAAIGAELKVEWRETLAARWQLARICARSTDIRLRLPEAYRVHQSILDWDSRFSVDRVPAASVGVDPITLRMMRWLLRDWRRVRLANRFFAGTLMPRIQLDLIPGLSSAAYFVVSHNQPPSLNADPVSLVRAGERLQRFWLTATHLGLAMQPALAPLCFAYYDRIGAPLSERAKIARLAREAEGCFGRESTVLFLGRIGMPRTRTENARSIRRNTADLVQLSSQIGNQNHCS
jgi:sulfur-carrier protein adenylyltransferase/sulfurtransferase